MLQILDLHIRRRVFMSGFCHPNLHISPVLRSGILYFCFNFTIHFDFKEKTLKLDKT